MTKPALTPRNVTADPGPPADVTNLGLQATSFGPQTTSFGPQATSFGLHATNLSREP